MKRSGVDGNTRLSRKPSAPSAATIAIVRRMLFARRSFAGSHSSSNTASAHGSMLRKPFMLLDTPNDFTSVGNQYVTPYSDVDISM